MYYNYCKYLSFMLFLAYYVCILIMLDVFVFILLYFILFCMYKPQDRVNFVMFLFVYISTFVLFEFCLFCSILCLFISFVKLLSSSEQLVVCS